MTSLREDRDLMDQYSIGELVECPVKRFERGNVIVDLGHHEATLPRAEQSRGEQFNQGERIRVVIAEFHQGPKHLEISVSRSSPQLLKRLFEREVPEIGDQRVIIKAAVREPGEKAKIAVTSTVLPDPVSVCTGVKGSRVLAITRELRGEKIDIVLWSDDPQTFVTNALAPAIIKRMVITDTEPRHIKVIVADDQLTAAIGKRGVNMRLASALSGWRLDIGTEEDR